MLRTGLAILLAGMLALEAGAQETARSAVPPASEWHELSAALRLSAETGRPTLVYVHAAWCGPCHRLEREVFPALASRLETFVRAGVDVTRHPEPGFSYPAFDWVRDEGLDVPPAFAVVDPSGEVAAVALGYRSASELRAFLASAVESR